MLALEWGRFNINVNGIGPGWFMTEMTKPGFIDQAVHEARVKGVPLQRLTDARESGCWPSTWLAQRRTG